MEKKIKFYEDLKGRDVVVSSIFWVIVISCCIYKSTHKYPRGNICIERGPERNADYYTKDFKFLKVVKIRDCLKWGESK